MDVLFGLVLAKRGGGWAEHAVFPQDEGKKSLVSRLQTKACCPTMDTRRGSSVKSLLIMYCTLEKACRPSTRAYGLLIKLFRQELLFDENP